MFVPGLGPWDGGGQGRPWCAARGCRPAGVAAFVLRGAGVGVVRLVCPGSRPTSTTWLKIHRVLNAIKSAHNELNYLLHQIAEMASHWLSPRTAPAPAGRGRSAKRGRGGGYRSVVPHETGEGGCSPLEDRRSSHAHYVRTSHLTVLKLATFALPT
jgi:hypothetical protein